MNRSGTGQEGIEQEAADWLAAIETGRADRPAFEAWRARDPAHAIAFIRVESAWRQFDRLDGQASAAPLHEEPFNGDEPSARLFTRRRAFFTLAGTIAASAAGVGVFLSGQAAAQTVETAVGERRRFYITDHMCLDLNTASRLRWWRTHDAVEVHLLRGEVSIDLAPSSPRCLLEVGATRVMASRGHFVARLRPNAVTDIVAVAGRADALPRSGQAGGTPLPERTKLVVTTAGVTTLPLSDMQLSAAVAWQEGELLFDGEPLSVAVEEFNRYLRTPMVLGDGAIATVRLGGRFLANDPAAFLKALHVNFGIRAEMVQDRILLVKDGTGTAV